MCEIAYKNSAIFRIVIMPAEFMPMHMRLKYPDTPTFLSLLKESLMPKTPTESMSLAHQATLDSFLGISRLYLQSMERLTSLNLSTLRSAVSDSTAASDSLAEGDQAGQMQQIQAALCQNLLGKTLEYIRGVQQIAAETQNEFQQLLLTQAQQPASISTMYDAWKSTIDAVVTQSQQLLTPPPAKNTKSNGGKPATAH